MELGTFSVSLTVQDIAVSRAFYEKLGFAVIAGEQDQNWLILSNGSANIGLFQGMFEKNILTFNPTDARGIQKALKADGVSLIQEADEASEGPTHLTLEDPDGNPILIDQHH
ncbi:MAG: VOC family protein [Acidobacteriota bacterium]